MKRQEQLTVKIDIPSALGYEKVVMSAIAVIAQKLAFPEDKIEDLKTAVSEACTNAIEYGNSSNIDLNVAVVVHFDQQYIRIDVIDGGHQPLPDAIPDRSDRTDFRGLGLMLMQMLMDKIELISQPGRNEVRMICRHPSIA